MFTGYFFFPVYNALNNYWCTFHHNKKKTIFLLVLRSHRTWMAALLRSYEKKKEMMFAESGCLGTFDLCKVIMLSMKIPTRNKYWLSLGIREKIEFLTFSSEMGESRHFSSRVWVILEWFRVESSYFCQFHFLFTSINSVHNEFFMAQCLVPTFYTPK